jgi:hypothetical protein
MKTKEITIIDVMRDMGVEPDKDITWPVGLVVSNHWRSLHGELPPSRLRQKTDGGGSHHFAVYPEEWRPLIEKVINQHKPDPSKQMSLF